MIQPIVTVICTCYNHAAFVKQSLEAVFAQTYEAVQLIVIDNASTDNSRQVIEQTITHSNKNVLFIKNEQNVGLCKAFNQGLAHATGKYVIDLAADDLMLPQRVEKQVTIFEKLPRDYAVVFSNASYIDASGQHLGYHYAIDSRGRAKDHVPSGQVYKEVLRQYFICTPTTMMRKSALMQLGGFDENLSYEDFDFFVRSAHRYQYHYLDQILTQKRLLPHSLAARFYEVGNTLLRSSWEVCNKAYDLSRTQEEYHLLAQRIRAFIRKCFISQDPEQATAFRKLLNYIEEPGWQTDALVWLCQLKLPVNGLYQRYARWRTQRHLQLMQAGEPFVRLEM